MTDSDYSHLYKRHATKEPRVTYRLRADGSKRYYVKLGDSHVPAGTTLEEAKGKKAELGLAESKGERIIVATRVRFEEIADEWWKQVAALELRESTLREYRPYFELAKKRFGKRRLAEIRPADILGLVREGRAKGLSESTIANQLKPLRKILDYAVTEKEVLAGSPFQRIGKGKLPSSTTTRKHYEWTTADFDRLIAVAHARDAAKQEAGTIRSDYGLAIEALLRTGLRLGELLGLQYGDVVTEDRDGTKTYLLLVRRAWTKDGRVDIPKTKKSERRVPLRASLATAIRKRRLERGATDTDFIFAAKPGMQPPLHGNWRRRGWEPAIKDAGLADQGVKITPHDARHAYASRMRASAVATSDIAEALGHTTTRTTENVYLHVYDRELLEARLRKASEA